MIIFCKKIIIYHIIKYITTFLGLALDFKQLHYDCSEDSPVGDFSLPDGSATIAVARLYRATYKI